MKTQVIAVLNAVIAMTFSCAVLAQEVPSGIDHTSTCLSAVQKQAALLKVALKVSRVDAHSNAKSVVCMVVGEKALLDAARPHPERVVVTLVLQPRDEGYHTVISSL